MALWEGPLGWGTLQAAGSDGFVRSGLQNNLEQWCHEASSAAAARMNRTRLCPCGAGKCADSVLHILLWRSGIFLTIPEKERRGKPNTERLVIDFLP